MPITHIEVPEVPSLYAVCFEGNVTYDWHVSSLQNHLRSAREQQARFMAFDIQPAIYIDSRLLNLILYSQRTAHEKRQRMYFLGDRYKIDQFFEKLLSWQGRKRLLIRENLETLVRELTAKP